MALKKHDHIRSYNPHILEYFLEKGEPALAATAKSLLLSYLFSWENFLRKEEQNMIVFKKNNLTLHMFFFFKRSVRGFKSEFQQFSKSSTNRWLSELQDDLWLKCIIKGNDNYIFLNVAKYEDYSTASKYHEMWDKEFAENCKILETIDDFESQKVIKI